MSANPRRDAIPRVAELAAWSAGLLLLAVYAGLRARQTVAAAQELRDFERVRASALSWAAPDQSLWSPERIRAWQKTSGGKPLALAVLRIPRISLEVPVLEGTDDPTLDRGVGHIAGTPTPGGSGNVGIAGHRDGFFRGLKDVVQGDAIDVETLSGSRRYVIESIVIVEPTDVWVLDPSPSDRLTLVTCYPFYYNGSAPHRYIVRASASPAAQAAR